MATRNPRTRPWTRADLERLPDDGNRYEVLDGELFVTPQAEFRHQDVATRIAFALKPYCDLHGIGVVVGPGAVVFGKNELQPDVQVVPGRDHPRKVKWKDLPNPILVVEVLSDSTKHRDVGKKRDAYTRIHTPVYWIVDSENATVTVWRDAEAEPVVATKLLTWEPVTGIPALEIQLSTIFD